MEETIFGAALRGGVISEGLEPAAFAEALRGFAEFITTFTEWKYGESGNVTLKVHRLAQGSLILELLQHVGDATDASPDMGCE